MSVQLAGKSVEIIDAHVHTFPDRIAPSAVGKLAQISGITPATDGTVGDTLTKMDQYGVDRAVLLNIATAPKQQNTINNSAHALEGEEWKGRFLSFGSVHFLAEDALSELERIQALGLKGVKLHPDYQGFMIDDPRLYPIYEKCAELGLVIVFHAGWDCYSPDLIHAVPEASRRVLRQFPELKVVLAHFGGLNQWKEVGRWLIGENVWLDTAMCATYAEKKEIEHMIRSHNPEQVLLGSDCPWENPQRSISFVLDMDLSTQQKEQILSGNAKKLYDLSDFA